jgi:hypothetical protein
VDPSMSVNRKVTVPIGSSIELTLASLTASCRARNRLSGVERPSLAHNENPLVNARS